MSGRKRPEARPGDVVKIGRAGRRLFAVIAVVRPPVGVSKRERGVVAYLGNGRRVKLSRLIVVKPKGGKS